MLKNIRVTLAVIFFVLITLLFLDISGVLHKYFAFLAEIQFVPALLALNIVILIALLALTLIFGRIYCSIICPMGVYQDIVAWFARRIKSKKKRRYTFSPPKTVLRLVLLAVFIVGIVAGIAAIPAILDPYGAYGRMVSELASPLYVGVNNLFAGIAERTESYAFYPREIWMKGLFSFVLALVTLLAIGYLAWRNGRTYCNTICPVGTILGYVSKFSLLKLQIDESSCTKCGRCARDCKAACIDFKNHDIDYTRCVTCFDCIESCRDNSITYALRSAKKKEPVTIVGMAPEGSSRRQFFITSAVLATAAAEAVAQQKKRSMIDVPAVRKEHQKRTVPVSPPGSLSHDNLNDKCTACLLCVSQCPEKIIRPSVTEYGWASIMQPILSYEYGYCKTDCTVCADVCPTDAITKYVKEDKAKISVGKATYVRDNCIVVKDDVNCDGCFRICPTEAISRVTRDGALPPPEIDPNPRRNEDVLQRLVPVVDEEKCIGCGACEYVCPARPLAAIYVEGCTEHKTTPGILKQA